MSAANLGPALQSWSRHSVRSGASMRAAGEPSDPLGLIWQGLWRQVGAPLLGVPS